MVVFWVPDDYCFSSVMEILPLLYLSPDEKNKVWPPAWERLGREQGSVAMRTKYYFSKTYGCFESLSSLMSGQNS